VASGAAGRANFALHAKLSFSECKFPSRYKTASVTPLTGPTRVQKKELDPDVASNYTPISNAHDIQDVGETVHGMNASLDTCGGVDLWFREPGPRLIGAARRLRPNHCYAN